MAQSPTIAGEFAGHPAAAALAREVLRVHHRYASEVVKAFGLCPFLRDAETAFGDFCVMLDREPVVSTALAVALAARSEVVHLVYPLARPPTRVFEKFAAALSEGLKRALPKPPVFAVFHPDLSGDRVTPSRLVGLLRRAPDPFVQLVPEGLQPGGTVLADISTIPELTSPRGGIERLAPEDVDRLLVLIDEIHAERDARYASLVAAFG
jgi:hypothetical protein